MTKQKDCPNWIRAKYLITYLLDNLNNESEESFEETYDKLLNKITWVLRIKISTGDEIQYAFNFTNRETPDFLVDEDLKVTPEPKKQYTVLCGIPYPALLAISASKSKKEGLLTYIDLIKEILIAQTLKLLDCKYDSWLKKSDGTEIECDGKYNNPVDVSSFAGLLLGMFSEYESGAIKKFIKEVNTDRDKACELLNKLFNDTYVITGVTSFINEATKENLDITLSYIESQIKNLEKIQIQSKD